MPWRKLTREERAQLSSVESAAIGPDELPDGEKEKDRILVRGIPKILAQAGYTVVKIRNSN